jgi:hypothetical protein
MNDRKVYGTGDGEWMMCHQCSTEAMHCGSRWAHSPEDCVRVLVAKVNAVEKLIRKAAPCGDTDATSVTTRELRRALGWEPSERK